MTLDSPSPPSQELNFPPVRVDHSLTKLDLEALMMRSHATPHSEEPRSPLDDSTYELLGEVETSDDEGRTASIASTDDHTPDDASDFSDDDDDYGLNDADTQESTYITHEESEHTQRMDSAVSGDSSILTEIPAHMEDSDSLRQIQLDEHSLQEPGVVEGSKTVKSYWAHENPEVFGRYECNEVRLVVRAALSERPMPTPDAYRVLYIGMPDKWLEDTIMAKLGEALTASPSVSKSVVVRGQVQPYNPPIHVWRCTEFQSVNEKGRSTHVLAILDDGKELRFGPKLSSSSLDRPDLVVFCHPTIATSAEKQEFANAEQVFDREKLPSINIGQVRSHGDGLPTYDSKALSLCVEGRNTSRDEFQLKEVLPLDHFAFSQLDALQLNRHLALISPHLAFHADKKNNQGLCGSWFRNTSNKTSKSLGVRAPLLKSLSLILLSLVIVPAILQGVAYAPGLMRQVSKSYHAHEMFPQAEPSEVYTTPVVEIVSALPSTVKSGTSLTTSELSLTPPRAEVPKQTPKKKEVKSWQYEIEGVSDRQFVLRPSQNSPITRKKPQLRISVTREAQVVPIQYNRTIDGTYVIDLVRDYPVGSFNVSVVSYSKPKLQQSFEIVLGHNKSKFDELLDIAKVRMLDTKTLLSTFSSSAMRNLETGLETAESVTYALFSDTDLPMQRAVQRLQQAQSALEHTLALHRHMLTEAPGAAWAGIRQATAPLRTSTSVRKARNNALRFRCKAEEVVGISSKEMNMESWACAKSREA